MANKKGCFFINRMLQSLQACDCYKTCSPLLLNGQENEGMLYMTVR
jgi:hypothetical protein